MKTYEAQRLIRRAAERARFFADGLDRAADTFKQLSDKEQQGVVELARATFSDLNIDGEN